MKHSLFSTHFLSLYCAIPLRIICKSLPNRGMLRAIFSYLFLFKQEKIWQKNLIIHERQSTFCRFEIIIANLIIFRCKNIIVPYFNSRKLKNIYYLKCSWKLKFLFDRLKFFIYILFSCRQLLYQTTTVNSMVRKTFID